MKCNVKRYLKLIEIVLTLGLFLDAHCLAVTEISNRSAKQEEWGYHPVEEAVVKLNPPSLTWIHESMAETYTVQWDTNIGFSNPSTITNIPWCVYTHYDSLAQGKYYWRYRYTTKSGENSNWSKSRSFIVDASAMIFALPNRQQQKEKIPAGHPRLFVRAEKLTAIKAKASSEMAAQLNELKNAAEAIIKTGKTLEPKNIGSIDTVTYGTNALTFWWPNVIQTMAACNEVQLLCLLSLLTDDVKYQNAARDWVVSMSKWDPDGTTGYVMSDECAMPVLYTISRAYDWAYNVLTETERENIKAVMQKRATNIFGSKIFGNGNTHLNNPYNSHANRLFHMLGETGIAFYGELDNAATWLDFAVNTFYACYPVWSDDDGGWHEGSDYWAEYMSRITWWLEAVDNALQIDGFKKPYFDNVIDFPFYMGPPNSPNMGMADLSYRQPTGYADGFIDYFIKKMSGKQNGNNKYKYFKWWMDKWKLKPDKSPIGFLISLNMQTQVNSKAPTELPLSKVFQGTGIVSMHSSLLDSLEDVHIVFKASPFGSRSHGHDPQNSFQLNAYGEALLPSCEYWDYWGSPWHFGYACTTKAQNAVLVDGIGQLERSNIGGTIIESQFNTDYDWVIGDGSAAYNGILKKYFRSIVFIKPNKIIVCDSIAADKSSTFQFMLHGLSRFEVDETNATVKIVRPKAGATIKYMYTSDLTYKQWDGYDPKPSAQIPNQWHVQVSTIQRATNINMVTVIVPYKGNNEVAWSADLSTNKSENVSGVVFHEKGKKITVGFKSESNQEAQIEGNKFTTRVYVKSEDWFGATNLK